MFGLKHYAHNATQKEESFLEKEEALLLSSKKNKQKRAKRIFGGLLFGVIFFAITTAYSQYQMYILSSLLQAQEKASQEPPKTVDEVVKAVSRHIKVPVGVPQIAAVTDAKKLASTQVFFKDVVNGDIVVVYDSVIYLYRPLEDVLVSVGDISGEKK